MNKNPNGKAAVAASANRPISVLLTDPRRGDRMRDDELDRYVTDPLVVERYGRQRKEKETSRVLEILDQLERGKAR